MAVLAGWLCFAGFVLLVCVAGWRCWLVLLSCFGGFALLAGWLRHDIGNTDVLVIEPFDGKILEKHFNVPVLDSLDKLNVEFPYSY